jgi:sterol desaturase/sphingolipid hydroxylase (fatty acid hydroxylase superfamily)
VKATAQRGWSRQIGRLVLAVCLLAAISWAGMVAMSCAQRLAAGQPLTWNLLSAIPTTWANLAVLPIMAMFLLVDRVAHGPGQFASGRLFARIRYDLFFVLAYATGANQALHLAFSFGLANWVVPLCLPLALLRPIGEMPFWAQIPVAYIFGNFGIYWGHRFLHTRLMWPLHAIHHAATDMTALTDLRAHPLDDLIFSFPVYICFALVGFDPTAVLINGLVARVHFALIHSSAPFPPWLEGWVLCGPRLHRVHHTIEEEYLNRNFCGLVIWDRLFGTYALPPDAGSLAIGVTDPRYATGRPVRDMLAVTGIWIAGCKAAGAQYLRRFRSSSAPVSSRAEF